jgi:hypothetical protein
MLQHPSNFTKEGYELANQLFCNAFDHNRDTLYILEKNREAMADRTFKIVNPGPVPERVRVSTKGDIFVTHKGRARKGTSLIHTRLYWRVRKTG